MTLQQLIDEKAFPTSQQPSAPMVLRVDDLLEWMLVEVVGGQMTIVPEVVDGKEGELSQAIESIKELMDFTDRPVKDVFERAYKSIDALQALQAQSDQREVSNER